MNVNNNNIPNNPIGAPAIGQQNAPVHAPNIQQVAAHLAPQGIDQAPAAGQINQAPLVTPQAQQLINDIRASVNEGNTYNAVALLTENQHTINIGRTIEELAVEIATNWSNNHYQNELIAVNRIFGFTDIDAPISKGILALDHFFLGSSNKELRNAVVKILAEKTDLDANFRRDAVNRFIADDHPDKADLLRMCEAPRFLKTKSSRK